MVPSGGTDDILIISQQVQAWSNLLKNSNNEDFKPSAHEIYLRQKVSLLILQVRHLYGVKIRLISTEPKTILSNSPKKGLKTRQTLKILASESDMFQESYLLRSSGLSLFQG